VPRKAILGRYGMAGWNESRLKKLFQTLDVAPGRSMLNGGADTTSQ